MLRRRAGLAAISLDFLTLTTGASGASAALSIHASGIALVGPEVMQARPSDEKQATAFNLALQFAMDHPDDFGYPWLDPATGTVEVSAANAEGSRQARSFALALGDVPNRIRDVEFSLAELQTIRNEITSIRGSDVDGEDAIYVIEPDEQQNRLIVTIDRLNDGFLNELASRFGPKAVAIRVDPNVGHPGPARHHDIQPFWGGAEIYRGNPAQIYCSSGCAWSNGTLWDGMLTAAHCAPTGGMFYTPAEYIGSVTSGTRENWTEGVGTVYYGSETIYRGDVALIQIALPKLL